MSQASDIIGRANRPYGLSDRALRFAKLYAQYPYWGATLCAKEAGYSNEGRAAHVRGSELLRDARVQRAIVHYGAKALAKAQAVAADRLQLLADGGPVLSGQDRVALRNLRIDLGEVAARYARLDAIMGQGTKAA